MRLRQKLKVAGGLAALALGALGSVLLGIVPLGASGGHWAPTRWFLETVKHRTVAARTWRTRVPPLADDRLVVLGAAHFETACRPCHGAPGSPPPETLRMMLPRPPQLPARVREWDDAALFWIVKHGIKFTGMPGWPDQRRDDEVWAVVAFIRRLPGMEPAEYRRLAYGDSGGADASAQGAAPGATAVASHEAVSGMVAGRGSESDGGTSRLAPLDPRLPPAAASCHRCHGESGNGRSGAFPRLAGQPAEYLANALAAYADGRRSSGVMRPVAAALDDEAIRALAEHFSRKPASAAAAPAVDREAVARGEQIARRGVPAQRVPACVQCHGPSGHARNPGYPRLAGQDAHYLESQLRLFQEGKRGGSRYVRLMEPVARRLTGRQRSDVAAYFSSLSPEPGS